VTRPLPLSLAAAWGALCGGVLGALRTAEAALHLLAKNRALEAAGKLSLPGSSQWEAMASWVPGFAGALFFGLSLGLGAGTLFGLWARNTRALPTRFGRVIPWLVLGVPLWALWAGDGGLAACTGAAAVGAAWSQTSARGSSPRAGLLRALLLAPLAVALIPWATAPEGAFTRLRDRFLLASPVGAALDRFYYRWTLYPAEALKPVAALSQPTAFPQGGLPPADRDRFCRQAQRLGVLCVGDPAGADFEVAPSEASLALVRGETRVPWPDGSEAQTEAWQRFSAGADRSLPLRRATALALFAGCPLALCWGISSLALAGGSLLGGRRRQVVASLVLSGLLAASLGTAGLPDPALDRARELGGAAEPDPQAVREALGADSPVARFYGARAAARARVETSLLIDALSDPVVNVRYAAAESLGRVNGLGAREALLEVLASDEEWYVKERAYSALWRLGWRPR